MEQRVSLITLGVADLRASVAFYTDVLGWRAEHSPPSIAFFDLGGLVLGLYPHAELVKDTGLPNAGLPSARSGPGYAGWTLAHNARSRAEVDAIFARLRERGAAIVKPPQEVFWGGYSGYFADPDGHLWEVAHNPYWTVREDGRIELHPPAA